MDVVGRILGVFRVLSGKQIKKYKQPAVPSSARNQPGEDGTSWVKGQVVKAYSGLKATLLWVERRVVGWT